MYSFPKLEPVCCSMSSYNCYFFTCIQISQESGRVAWYFPVLCSSFMSTIWSCLLLLAISHCLVSCSWVAILTLFQPPLPRHPHPRALTLVLDHCLPLPTSLPSTDGSLLTPSITFRTRLFRKGCEGKERENKWKKEEWWVFGSWIG